MAKCDKGYLCSICGEAVDSITESELYLKYVIGMIDPESLHIATERHLRCNPALAQFITDERFPHVACPGEFDKRQLDPEFVQQRETLVTRGWQRLCELAKGRAGVSILEYPLPEFRPQEE
jgi:hypothetical protein